MKRLIPLIVTIFCIAQIGYSQSNYRKGYIVTNAGDTVSGVINYRETSKIFKSCDFKSSENQDAISYKPGEILGYGFDNDKFFQSKQIPVKDQPSQVAFAEVIIRGIVSLYKFEYVYFVEKNDGGLQPLINETKEVFINGRKMSQNSNQYIGTLNMLLFDCEKVRSQVQNARLDEKILVKLIRNYNLCKSNESIVFKETRPWVKVNFGLAFGAHISKLDFIGGTGYSHLTRYFKTAKSATTGLSFDVSSPRLGERFSVHGGAFYLSSTYYSYDMMNTGAGLKRNYVTIELEQLKIPVGIRYTFLTKDFTPYINIGISSTSHLSSNSKWILEVEANNVVETFEQSELPIEKNQFGSWAGIGMLKSVGSKLHAFVELRYERASGLFPKRIQPESRTNNFQILIGIRTK